LSSTALVLSGGGARGAYEVGVVAGIVEVLGLKPGDAPPFRIFAGTSVGAINAVWLASQVHRGDLDIDGLTRFWKSLQVEKQVRFRLGSLLGVRLPSLLPTRRVQLAKRHRFGRYVLDARPFERLLRDNVSWRQLASNANAGKLEALVLAALHVATGQTTVFAEMGAGRHFPASRDPRRRAVQGPIGAEHVLASSAIPLLFPVRKIAGEYYCDGGLRFNTPIAPALRAGAERIVVVSLLYEGTREISVKRDVGKYLSPAFLIGKVFNALLLDPLAHDLHVLDRLNGVVDVLDSALEPSARADVDRVLSSARGKTYRRVEPLVFRPSRDIGRLAARWLRVHLPRRKLRWLERLVFRVIGGGAASEDADLASYLLFDGEFAGELIALGRRDALARADEIRAFFSE